MKESDIRRIINDYSRQTSGHPFYCYGNDIKIVVNDDCPVSECIIRTQYEDRTPREQRRPYRGRSLAAQKYVSLDEVDVWSFRLKTPEDFIDRKTVMEVEGSARVDTCGSCQGAGSTTCFTCMGKGKDTCPTCHGNYDHVRCRQCDGRGYTTCRDCGGRGDCVCSKCKGTGTITEMISEWRSHYDQIQKKEVSGYEQVKKTRSCPACSGRGHWRCNTCGGRGTLKCTGCGGNGFVTCTNCTNGFIVCKTCAGKGQTVCRVCEGAGRNETRYTVNRTLSQSTLRGYVCDRRVREFAESHQLTYTSVDFDTRGKVLEGELYTEDVRCSSKLGKLLAKTEPDSGIILFQEAIVQHVLATWIEYGFKGSSYKGIICNDVFYPDGSPIDEWSSSLVDSAEKKMRKGSSAKSLEMLDQAEAAGADRTEIGKLRSKALMKLGNLQSAGTSVAFWMVVLFFSPIFFNFYYKLNPVASWAIVTNNPGWRFFTFVPLCQTLIFLVVAVALRLWFGIRSSDGRKQHSSIWIYFAKGFFGYLLAALAATAVLLVFNYLGLSILTTFILGVILTVVIFVIAMIYLIIRWIIQLF